MDGLPGLESLFQKFPLRAQTQRCQKHAKANACRQVRKAEREEFSKDLNRVFYAHPLLEDSAPQKRMFKQGNGRFHRQVLGVYFCKFTDINKPT